MVYVLCVIAGMIFWELLSAYIHFVIQPWWRKRKARQSEMMCGGPGQQTEGNYKETSMGFNAQLKS